MNKMPETKVSPPENGGFKEVKPSYPTEIYKTAIYVLAMVLVIVLFGIIILSYQEKEVNVALVAMGSAALGGVVAIFSSSNKN